MIKNKKLLSVCIFAFVVCFVFSFSVNCFASNTYQYGGFNYVNSLPNSWFGNSTAVSKFLYQNFGIIRVQNQNYGQLAISPMYFVFEPFGRTSDPLETTSIDDFIRYIGRNSVRLLLGMFDIDSDYYAYVSSLGSEDDIHWQVEFTCNVQLMNISIKGNSQMSEINSYTLPSGMASFDTSSNTWDKDWVIQDGNTYVVNYTGHAINGQKYLFFALTPDNTDRYVNLNFTNSLNPFWEKNTSTALSNVYNIGSGTDLSYIYQYLDLITEWLHLIQQTELDNLTALTDMYTLVSQYLNTINSNLSTITTNTNEIRIRCQQIFGELAAIENQEILTNQKLDTIINLLGQIIQSLQDIEDRFVTWTENQSSGQSGITMKAAITNIFNWVSNFFRVILGFAISADPLPYYNGITNFDGSDMFGS